MIGLIIVALVILPAIIWFLMPSDIKKKAVAIIDLITVLLQVKIHQFQNGGKAYSIADLFEERVDAHPNRVQFVSVEDSREVTLQDMEKLANQIAWWLNGTGLKQKDTVALMMLNRPEFVTFWLGCSKIGVACSLINTNSSGKTLLHASSLSLKETQLKFLIVDNDLKEQISGDIKDIEAAGISVIYWEDVLKILKNCSTKRPPRSLRSNITEREALMLIFTSGTTGLPKASKITQSRFIIGSLPYSQMAKLTPRDRIYNAMPLYHSAAGMLGVGTSIRTGAAMVLRKKFSARSFASDCVKFNCTSMQYIGELCRYLLASPPSSDENKLNLRTAFGNGIRPDVWVAFQTRFHIKRVIEFYSSTEGNLGLFNPCDKVGALGYVPRWADFIYPVTLVRADPDDQSIPYRNAKGRCVRCKPDEVGLLIGPIDNKRVDRRFDGYTDSEATKKKVLRGVFSENDSYFNTGDLLHRDKAGFYFWSDRVGDTFRWKAENVATSEVGEVLASCPGIKDVTVYGVQVPGCDGRAGMAAIVLKDDITLDTIDWTEILNNLSLHLPTYARPLFFRVKKILETTSTFKHLKGDLVKEGFDPENMKGDPLYFHFVKEKKVVPLSKDIFNDIKVGKMQL